MSEHKLKPIRGFLDAYKKRLRAPQQAVVSVFQDVVMDVLSTTIQKSNIRYDVKTQIVHVTAAGPQKHEVLLHKKTILTMCATILGTKNSPRDVV